MPVTPVLKLFFHLYLDLPNVLIPSDFPIKYCKQFSTLSYVLRANHVILLNVKTQVMFNEEDRLWSSSLVIISFSLLYVQYFSIAGMDISHPHKAGDSIISVYFKYWCF